MTKTSTAIFALPPRVHLLDFGGPAQVYYEAQDEGAPLTLKYVSINNSEKEVATTCGVNLTNLIDFRTLSLKPGDVIFVPGLEFKLLEDRKFLSDTRPFLEWMNQQYRNGVTVCSVCTGAFLLAESGLLDGKECTTHWKYVTKLRSRYSNVHVVSDRLFVENKNIFTSAGVASGIDLALYMLEIKFGSLFASKIAREIVIYMRREAHDPQLSIFLRYRNHLNDRVHIVQEWMIHHFRDKLTTEQLAEIANTSSRHLTRLFKEATGITLGQYLEKIRMEHAVQLLKENNKIQTIANACGLESPNQLRQLFKKHFGVTPSEYKMS